MNGADYNSYGANIGPDEVLFCQTKGNKALLPCTNNPNASSYCSYHPEGISKKNGNPKGWIRKSGGQCQAIYLQNSKGPRCIVTLQDCPFLSKGKPLKTSPGTGVIKTFSLNDLYLKDNNPAFPNNDPLSEDNLATDLPNIAQASGPPPYGPYFYDVAVQGLPSGVVDPAHNNKFQPGATFLDHTCDPACDPSTPDKCQACCDSQFDYWKNFCTLEAEQITKDKDSNKKDAVPYDISLPVGTATFNVPNGASFVLKTKEFKPKDKGSAKKPKLAVCAACYDCTSGNNPRCK